jgi:hypothetical protein
MATAEHSPSYKGEASDQTSKVGKWIARSPPAKLLTLPVLIDWGYFSLDTCGRLIEVSDRLAQLLSLATKD